MWEIWTVFLKPGLEIELTFAYTKNMTHTFHTRCPCRTHSHLHREHHKLNSLFKMLKDLLPLTWETSSRPDRWKPYGRLTLTNVRNIKNTSIFLQVRKTNPYKHREYCRSTSKLKNIHRITPTYVGNISLIWGMLLLMRTHPYLRRKYLVLFLASVEPRDSPPLK